MFNGREGEEGDGCLMEGREEGDGCLMEGLGR